MAHVVSSFVPAHGVLAILGRVAGVGLWLYRGRAAALVAAATVEVNATAVLGRARQPLIPNQRARRLDPKWRFSATSSVDGSEYRPVGVGPEKKSTSTRPTRPPPNSR